ATIKECRLPKSWLFLPPLLLIIVSGTISRSGKKLPWIAATTIRHNSYPPCQGLTSPYNRGTMLRPLCMLLETPIMIC
ncbi:uncharacterized protein EV420DRAFT_1585054, partial [Desarmillaria tabescens]